MKQVLQFVLLSCVLCSFSKQAVAEEGLFLMRLTGGVSSVHPQIPNIGQMWNVSADLALGEKTGIIAGAVVVLHDEARSLALHLGIKHLLVEGFWNRIYIHISPEALRNWGGKQEKRYDLGLRGGLGYEHTLTWGLGLAIELHGSAPVGLGDAEPFDAATVGMTAGFFMEF